MPEYKNRFAEPDYYENVIIGPNGKVGTLRLKPSTVLWKPSSGKKFYSVSLEKFEAWITHANTKARKTTK